MIIELTETQFGVKKRDVAGLICQMLITVIVAIRFRSKQTSDVKRRIKLGCARFTVRHNDVRNSTSCHTT